MVTYIEDELKKELIADSILRLLPDWFGIPENTGDYIQNAKKMPFWAEIIDDKAVGFISLKETSPHTAEIYVMGVQKTFHRSGIGKNLFEAFYSYAKEHGYSFLQVKTVKEGYYEFYDKTNLFYKKMGFKELECFPTLWDKNNPCQVFVMAVV